MNTTVARPSKSTPTLTPGLTVADPQAAYWLSRVTLQLRREMCWCWHQRTDKTDTGGGVLPPVADAAAENLSRVRYEKEKRHFFATDVTAAYLTNEIARLEAPTARTGLNGGWEFLVKTLRLDEAAQFVLALGLAAHLDAGLGPVFANCVNDQSRPYPTLALAQRLWDEPLAIVACADPGFSLFRYGLLTPAGGSNRRVDWYQPLEMPSMVAGSLLDPGCAPPQGVELLKPTELPHFEISSELLVARLKGQEHTEMCVVPLVGPPGAAFADWAAAVGKQMNRPVARLAEHLAGEPDSLSASATLCWMRGWDILLPEQWADRAGSKDGMSALAALQPIPLRWYMPMNERRQLADMPPSAVTPHLLISGLTFEQRMKKLRQSLGRRARGLDEAIEECARRFRFQGRTVELLAQTFADPATDLNTDSLLLAARNEAGTNLGNLAQLVLPRFGPDDLVLPDGQTRRFNEVVTAMRNITRVHYRWGTAKVWNESGLSVLFCGTSGTGKTMAAEVLSTVLDLPMYRIDLSQVVNKYIGETEKNLKRIFDAAELSDCILFFDEADALFGKRTEVKDAHDRFANIEISYLLERMERFKGLAILATNRRKDLDEAFMRRLRYIIEFPIPGIAERERIWRQVFPASVDLSEVDFPYLARQFQLSGGHIRSIAFNACLQSAGDHEETRKRNVCVGKVSMGAVLVAVKRELEKMNRAASEELFGAYRETVKELVA